MTSKSKTKKTAPKKLGPVYTYRPDGSSWRLIKREGDRVVLTQLFLGRRALPVTKRPSKVTFARDFELLEGVR